MELSFLPIEIKCAIWQETFNDNVCINWSSQMIQQTKKIRLANPSAFNLSNIFLFHTPKSSQLEFEFH